MFLKKFCLLSFSGISVSCRFTYSPAGPKWDTLSLTKCWSLVLLSSSFKGHLINVQPLDYLGNQRKTFTQSMKHSAKKKKSCLAKNEED